MSGGMLQAALRRALAAFPATPSDATALLESQGYDAKCNEAKHITSHSIYHVECKGEGFVIKVSKDS